MQIHDTHYVMVDYGEGTNLAFEGQYTKGLDFHIKELEIRGTPVYLDPLLWQAYNRDKEDIQKGIKGLPRVKCDLFKADIYSVGLSLLGVASGQTVSNLNQGR